MTSNVLLTSCFRYNSQEKSTKFPNSNMNLSKKLEFPCEISIIKYLEDVKKITSF